METPEDDDDYLGKTNGRWRNALAIFDKRTKKFNVYLFTFKMLIFALKMCPFAVPLGFMYKHGHGYFVPVGAAIVTLRTLTPVFSDLVQGFDPVDRKKGRFLGTVSAAVVAMAYIQLHQWKWEPGIQGLFARLLCACMDEANASRNFAASITGGVWLVGQLAARAPFEPLQCLQGCAEKCHGDYLCVLAQLVAELLPLFDTRSCGLLQEMKCKYCGDDGQIKDNRITLLPANHQTYATLSERLMGHGGQLTLTGIETYTYFHDGDPLLVVDTPPKRLDYPGHKYVVHQTTKRRSVRSGSGSGDPETAYHLYSQSPSGQWTLKVGAQQTIPKTSVDIEKLEACADNSKNNWASSFTGTLEQVNAQTLQQYEDLYEAVGVDPTSFISIRKANLTVNGAIDIAELLGAEGDKMMSECKEELWKKLADGRCIPVLTSTCTWNGDARVQVYIDGAHAKEALMKGQIACVVISIVFPEEIDEVTYQRGSGRKYTVAPPRDRKLYCVLDSHLSAASRELLILISIPTCFIYWGLCRLHGILLADDWLEKNPPYGHWTGNAELAGAFRDGICGPDDLRRMVQEIGARNADKLQLASPCAFKVGDFCDVLASCDDVDEALIGKVRDAVSGLGASVDDNGDAKMDDASPPHDDGFSSYLRSDERKAWAGEEDDADSMDDAPADDLVPPADLDAARNVQGDGGAARENRAAVPVAPPQVAPPNLGAVAGRPIPPAGAFDGVDPIGPSFTTPMFRALPNAPRKPQGPGGYRPKDDRAAPVHRFTFSDSEDEEKW